MFPPALPRYFIEQLSRPGDIVLDPFSGRGTTPLEACLAGRVGVGTDLNPLAATLTGAKVDPPLLSETLDRVQEMRSTYRRAANRENTPPEIKMLFDGRRTLPQLLHARRSLDPNRRVDRHLLAVLCGILHGNHPSDPRDSQTISISMPNTFSMSPGYIRRYIRDKGLRKYPFDVFDLLDRRLKFLNREPPPEIAGISGQRDARGLDGFLPRDSVPLIVTSPPYLRVVRYGKFNWIRLWLLGESVGEVDRRLCVEATDNRLRLTDQLRLPMYVKFMAEAVTSWERLLRPGGVCVLVIGDVESMGVESLNLAQEVWKEFRRSSCLKLVDVIEDNIETSGKVTRIWGNTKGHATKVDRVLVLKKPGDRRYRARNPHNVIRKLSGNSRGTT